MQDFGRDIRMAVRSAVRRPGYALAVISTLAIGIGANTAIFSLFNWILFRPLPVRGVVPHVRVVAVRHEVAAVAPGRLVLERDELACHSEQEWLSPMPFHPPCQRS